MDRERSESLHQSQPIEPPTLVITQTEGEFTIETRRSTSTTSDRLRDRAAQQRPATPTPAGGSRAYWDGAALVTEGARTVQGQTVSVRETRTLDDSGRRDDACRPCSSCSTATRSAARSNYGASKDVFRRVTP